MNMIFKQLCILPLFCAALILTGCTVTGETIDGNFATVVFTETEESFANPMKGFRPSRYLSGHGSPPGTFAPHEYATVYKHYIKYNDLEESPDDTAEKIIAWSDTMWRGIEERNIKVIPRVVLLYPAGPDAGSYGYWPEGLERGDGVECFIDPVFYERMVIFAQKLGQAWDNDPRVAAIEMGLWGRWGEHHVWPYTLPGTSQDRIPLEAQLILGNAFSEAFQNKKIMVRYGETFRDFDFGFSWDSFALPDDASGGFLIMERDVWRTQMISGEVAYNWGDQTMLGNSPDGNLIDDERTDYVIDWIEKMHCSSLGWIAEYSRINPIITANAARVQRSLGYRYVINSATYTFNVDQGGEFSISLDVSNVGSAPFYYNWPVELSLLDADKHVVWSGLIHVDIRNWLPGNSYTISDAFTLPSELQNGTYIIALAVLDPAGGLPSLRFANTNYYAGGYTPVGRVGVGQSRKNRSLEPYDSLYEDRTLYYTLDGPIITSPEDTQVYYNSGTSH